MTLYLVFVNEDDTINMYLFSYSIPCKRSNPLKRGGLNGEHQRLLQTSKYPTGSRTKRTILFNLVSIHDIQQLPPFSTCMYCHTQSDII